ncbi:S1C family serine protease [Candidatus Protofrankia californiensis]|uniref:S1C family serine protease n=1 Tax=Candidatus Protofrankia californiensis TaxID=1839754 RepID=UPI001F495453|nr:trypsin-like peptidase domain-containing protein [Candidatus Protofrankia californiensis]
MNTGISADAVNVDVAGAGAADISAGTGSRTTAAFVSADVGYPDDSVPAKSRRSPLVPAAAMLLAGLLGGVTGGMIGAHNTYNNDYSRTAPAVPARSGVVSSDISAPVERTMSVSAIAARVLPSVVTISVATPASTATGSGLIIRSDGYILTNNHVVANAAAGARVSVTLYQELQQISAKIVGRDPKTDLAVIRIQTAGPLPAATLGRSGSLVVGAPLVAIGAPLGLAGTVTTGIVSALDRNPTVPAESGGESLLIGAIQTDAAINPGNSGGPLLDGRGQVIGINTAIATVPGGYGDRGASGNIGVGFAIPIDYAKSVAEEIIQTGRATHPHIGVSAVTITPDGASAAGTSPGAMVRGVEAGGSAALAGLRPGDIITKVNNFAVGSINDLIAATRVHRVGERITVTFERDRRVQAVEVTLQEQRD